MHPQKHYRLNRRDYKKKGTAVSNIREGDEMGEFLYVRDLYPGCDVNGGVVGNTLDTRVCVEVLV